MRWTGGRTPASPCVIQLLASNLPKPMLYITVADNGPGIDPALLPRVFEPFITTKSTGDQRSRRGMGLGLAIVRRIIQYHQGAIEVTSELGKGTTFHVYLPAAPSPAMSQPDVSPLPAGRMPGPRILPGPAALHALAAAFAHLQDFDGFVGGLQAALNQAEWFGRVALELADRPGAGEAQFVIGEMILPLQGAADAHGVLRVAGREEPRCFGPEDLHLLSGLADFLAVVLDHAREWREVERHRQLLGLLLNQAPVGILAFDEQHRVAAGNDLARRWLGGGDDLVERLAGGAAGGGAVGRPGAAGLFPPARGGPPRVWRAAHHRRHQGCRRRQRGGDDRPHAGAGAAARRPAARNLPLPVAAAAVWASALLESPRIAGGLLQQLPELRAGAAGGRDGRTL